MKLLTFVGPLLRSGSIRE